MDGGKYYALLRFEEASLALRAALKLGVVEAIGDREITTAELRDLFGFTDQGARTFEALLEVMEVLLRTRQSIRIAARAKEVLSDNLPNSRKPYLSMGTGQDVDILIEQLRGNFPPESIPLYGGDEVVKTVMDLPEAAREVSAGLASRARNFAEPLAAAISPYAAKARILADIGAGSPYVSQACLVEMPHLHKAILVDRANALLFAREMVDAPIDLANKLDFVEQDFFQRVPPADVYCLSNTAHDWLPEEYATIMTNIRDSIAPGGVVCVHEPLLLDHWNTAEDWVSALWMACYAMTLYKLTSGKGTCYTRHEHDAVMQRCGFFPVGQPVATRDGCTALFYKMQSDLQTVTAPSTANASGL